MMDSADPLQGWPLKDIIRHVPSAKNDIYGRMSLCMTDILTKFCQRLRVLKVSFTLFQLNATKLSELLENAGFTQKKFDRIEVSCSASFPQSSFS